MSGNPFLKWLSKDVFLSISHREILVRLVLQVLRVKRSSNVAFKYLSVCEKTTVSLCSRAVCSTFFYCVNVRFF